MPLFKHTLHFNLQLVRASVGGRYVLALSPYGAALDSAQIGRPHFLDGGVQADFGVLRWSKLAEI